MSPAAPARPPKFAPLPSRPTGTDGAPSRLWWAAAVVCALALVVLVVWLRPGATSDLPYAPDNPEPEGARAVAQILADHGVDVEFVRSTSAAVADARAGGTLLILDPGSLRPAQQQALAEAPGDIVLADLGGEMADLTEQVVAAAGGDPTAREARCSDDHAEAAGTVHGAGPMVHAQNPGVEVCFPSSGDDGGMYASWTEEGRTWRALGDGSLLTNANLTTEGNAALVLRMLGQHSHVTWYLPDPADTFAQDPGQTPVFPLFAPQMLVLYGLIALALVLWRGRRLGPVVLEPLPVRVKATETTRGRGRLYRRHGAFGHAGSALRAGAVERLAGRLGLSRSAGPDEVVHAVAHATGRPPEQIQSVLYSPPPHDNDSLVALAEALDTMESEVHTR